MPRAPSSFPTNSHSIHSKALLPLAPPSAHPHRSPELLLYSGTYISLWLPCPAARCRAAAHQGEGQSKRLRTAPHTVCRMVFAKEASYHISQHYDLCYQATLQDSKSISQQDMAQILSTHPFDSRGLLISGCKMPSLSSNFRYQFGTKWKSPTGSEQTTSRRSTAKCKEIAG